jgi:hypothetical protein
MCPWGEGSVVLWRGIGAGRARREPRRARIHTHVGHGADEAVDLRWNGRLGGGIRLVLSAPLRRHGAKAYDSRRPASSYRKVARSASSAACAPVSALPTCAVSSSS